MTNASVAPDQVVAALLTALRGRDFATARAMWHDDAIWHVVGNHDLARDYSPDQYLEAMSTWYQQWPAYTTEATPLRRDGPQGVIFHMTSSGGPAPGQASGWMLYRVNAGRVSEGWSIPTFGDGMYPF